jgi:K+-sensing histidine kinase KdpD
MNDNLSDREQFFSKLSHDLRGSFTSMLGFSDILNDPNEKLTIEEINEFVSRIGNQTKESYELLLNFINWLKLDTYNYGLVKEKINLLDLLSQTKTFYKRMYIENKIDIKFNVRENENILIDYEIANSIFNNIFLFLKQITQQNNTVLINSHLHSNSSTITIEFITKCAERDLSFLQNVKLKNLTGEISYPIIFAIKFTELSGGSFDFYQDLDNTIKLTLHLPSIK